MDSATLPVVLIVDDQAAIRDLFASFLRRAGIEVEQARDGIEAVRQRRGPLALGRALAAARELLDLTRPVSVRAAPA